MRKLITYLAAAAVTTAGAVLVSAGPASAAPVPRCHTALLHITHTQPQGGAGHSNMIIRFRNIGQTACSLRGYPGFDALKKNGDVLRHAKRTLNGYTGGAKKVRTIVVEPNHLASADVEWLNFKPGTGGECRFAHTVAITAPNATRTVHRKATVSACRLQIHPTVKGPTGNG